jgi:hypothetical protein
MMPATRAAHSAGLRLKSPVISVFGQFYWQERSRAVQTISRRSLIS